MSALTVLFVGLTVVATIYWIAAAVCVLAFTRRRPRPSGPLPPLTLLKPLCGNDPSLLDNLRSFCEQDYPAYQIVFGVSDPGDPSVDVVQQLMEDYPELDLALVVSDRVIGLNPKVTNLANLYQSAKHDVIVLADSDIRVGRDYLRTVVAPLAAPGTGMVTCLYRAAPTGAVVGRLGAMFIDEWFFPSALVAAIVGREEHAFGATIAARREVLDAVGGFEAIADQVADDYALSRNVASHGWRVLISSYVVETVVAEPTLRALFTRELRWGRTMRSARPIGYFFSALTYGLVWAVLGLVASGLTTVAVAASAAHVAVRLGVRTVVARRLGGPPAGPSWLLVVREALSVAVWALSFVGRTIRWRGRTFVVDGRGRLRLP